MISDASSTRRPTRVGYGLVLAFALVLGLGTAISHRPALAGVDGTGEASGPATRSGDVIVVAEKDQDGDRNGNKNSNNNNNKNSNNNNNNKNSSQSGNKNWNKNGNNNWNKNNNANWNNNKNWSHNGNKNWNNNNKNWSNNNKNWNKNGGHYNNNWNKNWNNRAYVRDWYRKPYYGEFFGGVVLGSILAANGVGIVPLAPQPDLCWYWADPYMYRGYWDYCY